MADRSSSDRTYWRVLRALLPRWYSRRYADVLFQTHIDRANARGTSGRRFWLELTVDVVLTTVQLRLDAAGRHTATDSNPRQAFGDPMSNTLRYAWRSITRAPAFSLAVVLTLAIGIAATATLFTLTDRLLLSAAPQIEAADQLRRIFVHGVSYLGREKSYSEFLTFPDFEDLHRVSGFTQLAGYSPTEMTVGDVGRSERARVELASASYFPTLGAQPVRGRLFTTEEDRIGAAPVALLSHNYWERRYGGDASAIGQRTRIGKGDYTIIGIMPKGFTGVEIDRVDFWVPMRTANAIESGNRWATSRRWWWIIAVARVEPERADAIAGDATRIYRAGRADVPGEDRNAQVTLASIIGARGPKPAEESRIAPALAGLALAVLLLSCSNVANLILARGLQRRRMLAIQTAIGLGPRQLAAQLMMEVVLLASVGGSLALVLTGIATPLLFRVLLPDAAVPDGVSLRLAAFMFLAVLIAALAVGLMPVLRSIRIDAFEALRFTRDTRRDGSLRHGLLFVQAGLCALLLVAAGMFHRSLEQARRIDMGVDMGTLMVQLELRDGSRFGTSVAEASYVPLDRIRALPSVATAAVTSIPHFFGNWGITIWSQYDSIASGKRGPFYYGAGGSYFETMGLRILRGRPLTDADDRVGAAPVVVVSNSFARVAFRRADPIGECLFLETRERCTRVVGVVEDALPSVRADAPNMNVYVPPHHPDLGLVAAGTIVVRPRGDAMLTVNEVRNAALAAEADIRMVEVRPLGALLDPQLRSWRLGAALLTAFGVVAIIVAMAGIYSVLAFDVAQRRFELGIRSALGASAGSLVRTSIARALAICGGGVMAGLGMAVLLAPMAVSLLFRVSRVEPSVYVPVFVLMLTAVAGAAALPAWRAVRADPRTALQGE